MPASSSSSWLSDRNFRTAEKTTDAFVGGPHQRDEGIKIDDLLRAMAIYAAALETLAA